MATLHRSVLALVLSLSLGIGVSAAAAAPGPSAGQTPGAAGGDSAKCPVQAADLDKITSYRWKFGRYQTDRVYTPTMTLGIRIDICEMVGMDAKSRMVTGVTMNIAGGAQAAPFAKYWRDVCANSLMADQRGKVQPLPGVTGGFQCVTPKGGSSNYWVESGGRTIQMEAGTDDLVPLVPKLLAAVR
jgi:hypothetical protein